MALLDTRQAKPRLKRIRLQSLLEAPLTLEEVTNSLVVTNEADTLQHDKALNEAVQAVVTLMASQGRHTNTSLFCCQHLLTNGKQTRLILSEASAYVVFPLGFSASQFRWLLTTYAGLDNQQLPAVNKHRSNAQSLIAQVPVIEVDAHAVAMCDGGGGATGHPIEFIKLDRRDGETPATCKYCGLRFVRRHGHHGH